MRKRRLGTTELQVTPLCLGTMQWGWTASEEEAVATMDSFVAAGGNFIDTADVYSRWAKGNPGGVAEEIIGRWMKDHGNREGIVIATKVRGQMWDGADGEGLSRVHIERAADDSLRRLQVETIDLYQTHWPDNNTPIDETLRAMEELIKGGKVRYIGCSNYDGPLLSAALAASETAGLPRYDTLQPNFSLAHRAEFEAELMAICSREGIGVIPYSPLAAGFLTGKYRRGKRVRSARADRNKQYMNEQGFGLLDLMDGIAEAHGVPLAAVALAWLLANPTVVAPIVGANSPDQLADQLPAVDLKLTPDEIESLNRASEGM